MATISDIPREILYMIFSFGPCALVGVSKDLHAASVAWLDANAPSYVNITEMHENTSWKWDELINYNYKFITRRVLLEGYFGVSPRIGKARVSYEFMPGAMILTDRNKRSIARKVPGGVLWGTEICRAVYVFLGDYSSHVSAYEMYGMHKSFYTKLSVDNPIETMLSYSGALPARPLGAAPYGSWAVPSGLPASAPAVYFQI